MEQRVAYRQSADGTKLAYAVAGHGFPLVRAATWLTGVQHDADHPAWRHWWREFAREHMFVRYDQRGCGASDRAISDFSVEARIADLEAVVDGLGFEQFNLVGHSHGAPVSIAYAAKHPERVHRLVLFNGFARGPYIAWQPPDVMEAVWQMITTSWDQARTPRMFAVWNMPDATPDVIDATAELMRQITSPDNVVSLMSSATRFDVTACLPRVQAPTLVMQSTKGEMNPADQSRVLATMLPNAICVDIESRNHILLPNEPGWRQFVAEFRAFCAAPEADLHARKEAQVAANLSDRELQVLRLIGDGKTDRGIGDALNISARTVSNHVKSILQKSETANRAHAVAWAAKRGLL